MVINSADTRVRDRISRFPIDSKLLDSLEPGMVSPVGVTTSLDFDGSTEELANSTLQDIGIGATWTLIMWQKKTANPISNVQANRINNAVNNANASFSEVHPSFPQRLNFFMYMSNGSSYKRLQDNDYWSGNENVWVMFGIRWGGGTDLQAVRNTTIIGTSDADPGSGGSTTQTNRRFDRWMAGMPQRIHSIAIFSSKLNDPNITAIYNGGDGTNFDLREDSGNYNQSANLEHWWVFGADDSSDNAMGTDYGFASNLINIMDNAANITTADLTADSPT